MTGATRLFLAAICGCGDAYGLQRVLPQASHWLSFLSGRTRNWQEFDSSRETLDYTARCFRQFRNPAFVHNARVRRSTVESVCAASHYRGRCRVSRRPTPHYRHCARIDQSSFDRAKCNIELQRRGWRSFTPFHALRQTYALSTIACVIQCVEPDAIDYIESFQSWKIFIFISLTIPSNCLHLFPSFQ